MICSYWLVDAESGGFYIRIPIFLGEAGDIQMRYRETEICFQEIR